MAKNFLKDITVNISAGFTKLRTPGYNALIVQEGAAAKDAETITQATDLIALGYVVTDEVYELALDYFGQDKTPEKAIVAQKLTGQTWTDFLDDMLEQSNQWLIVLPPKQTQSVYATIGAWCSGNRKILAGLIDNVEVESGAWARSSDNEFYLVSDIIKTAGSQKVTSTPTAFLPTVDSGLAGKTYQLRTTVDAALQTLSLVVPLREGHQDVESTGNEVFVPAVASGLAADTYYVDLAIDGAASVEYPIVVVGGETWQGIVDLIAAAISAAGATCVITSDNKIRFISNTQLGASAILLSTAVADDLFDAIESLVDYTSDELGAVAGAATTWQGLVDLMQTEIDPEGTCVLKNGYFLFTSATTGNTSSMLVQDGLVNPILTAISALVGYNTTIEAAVAGTTQYPHAALTGRKLGYQFYNQWKWKKLKGIDAVNYTIPELTKIRDAYLIAVTEQAGVIISSAGTVSSGYYIDLKIIEIYLEDLITLALFSLMIDNEVVSLDSIGLAQVDAAIRGALDSAGQLRIIVPITETTSDEEKEKADNGKYIYKVNVPAVSAISDPDKQSRELNNVSFSFTATNGIDKVDVSGTLVV